MAKKQTKNNRVVGILGGMGPQATQILYKKIITKSAEKYGAVKNSDFPYLIIHNIPIPEDIIENTSQKKLSIKMVAEAAKKLELSNCDCIVMPCNTMHLYLKDILNVIRIPFLSMVDRVIKIIVSSRYKKIGLLGSYTSLHSDLYYSPLEKAGVLVKIPSEENSFKLVSIIKDIISEKNPKTCLNKINTIIACFGEIDAVVLGCTELSLLQKYLTLKIDIIEPIEELSKMICEYVYTAE